MEIIATLVMTHITILCVTLYLHRSQSHRSVTFHPAIAHFMRFWLWLTTGMVTKQWVAVHRQHHAYSDTEKDPHSPVVYGLWRVLFGGAFLYAKCVSNMTQQQLDSFGKGTPDDWIERNIYTRYNWLGIVLMLVIDILLFGPVGIIVWGVQMLWIPFWAAGVINGLAHWIGYRNYNTKDTAHNLIPFGIIIGGEELHNNHHGMPISAKLSAKWFEIDIGWLWIKLFKRLGLVELKQEV